ncbi:MAG: hypothetical protein KC561_19790, partial [Myxococcales bacterium]|nr:hypothetical protein [Myxococcales bacterium]
MTTLTYRLLICGAVLTVAACATPTATRTVTADQLATESATMTGVGSFSTYTESTPELVPAAAVQDEVTLMVLNGVEACFDVTLRTESEYDRPFESLAVNCFDSRDQATVPSVRSETMSELAYPLNGSAPVRTVASVDDDEDKPEGEEDQVASPPT